MSKPKAKSAEKIYHAEVFSVSAEGKKRFFRDSLAVEEPLEIEVGFWENGQRKSQTISITMRTPGEDVELAVGFLFSEGLLKSRSQINSVSSHGANKVRVELNKDEAFSFAELRRNFYVNSSCGICGRNSIELLKTSGVEKFLESEPKFSADLVYQLPKILAEHQSVFAETGGLHASALFDVDGNLLRVREDIGRHNAVDKLVGSYFLDDKLPIEKGVLFLSGRASYELLQKAVRAKIPIVCAVGAPSSLAVQLAEEFGITLLGFVRENRFNVYTDFGRL